MLLPDSIVHCTAALYQHTNKLKLLTAETAPLLLAAVLRRHAYFVAARNTFHAAGLRPLESPFKPCTCMPETKLHAAVATIVSSSALP